jgi:hypothetical protein
MFGSNTIRFLNSFPARVPYLDPNNQCTACAGVWSHFMTRGRGCPYPHACRARTSKPLAPVSRIISTHGANHRGRSMDRSLYRRMKQWIITANDKSCLLHRTNTAKAKAPPYSCPETVSAGIAGAIWLPAMANDCALRLLPGVRSVCVHIVIRRIQNHNSGGGSWAAPYYRRHISYDIHRED